MVVGRDLALAEKVLQFWIVKRCGFFSETGCLAILCASQREESGTFHEQRAWIFFSNAFLNIAVIFFSRQSLGALGLVCSVILLTKVGSIRSDDYLGREHRMLERLSPF